RRRRTRTRSTRPCRWTTRRWTCRWTTRWWTTLRWTNRRWTSPPWTSPRSTLPTTSSRTCRTTSPTWTTTHSSEGAAVTNSAPVQAVDLALTALERHDRPDLRARLRAARNRLVDEQVRVLVVGEFKQGKSMLVNALVGAPVCPVFDDLATSVPTVVRHGDTATVTLVRVLDADGSAAQPRPERIPVEVEQLPAYAPESGNPDNRERLSYDEASTRA